MSGVSPIDQTPGQANVLMLKKAMEVQKEAGAMLVQMMSQTPQAPRPPANPPQLGQVVDVRM